MSEILILKPDDHLKINLSPANSLIIFDCSNGKIMYD